MLIRFSAKNYRSIKTEQELSCIAASALQESSAPLLDTKAAIGVDLLPVIAIYGANASGKSSVLLALQFMSTAVEFSQRLWEPQSVIPIQPFALDSDSMGAPSQFEIDLLIGNIRYQYGFSLDTHQILSEWCYAYPQGRRQTWFVRDAGQFRFGKNLSGENRSIQSLTRPNSLFLSAAAQNNHEALGPLYNWFASQLGVVTSESRMGRTRYTARLCEQPAINKTLLRLLGGADLGVIGIDFTERELSPDQKRVAELARQVLGSTGPTGASGATGAIPETRAIEILREPVVALRHKASADPKGVALPFEDESNGTQAFFALLGPILATLSQGGTLCVDELEASLHPLLAMDLVRIFNNAKRNDRKAQLIFNTHDTHLLTNSTLRRDQVWFTEKDNEGATHLYPLSDFKPRRHENFERGYLQGRYGAIPFIGDDTFGMTEEEAEAAHASQ